MLLNIVASVGGPWLYARICNAIITLPTLLDQHRERWIELMDERLKNHPDPDKVQLMAERLIKEHSDSETVQADHDELMQLAEEINIARLKEVKATEGP